MVNLTRETEIPVGTTLSLSANITTYNLPLTNITWFFNETITIDEEDRINLTIPSFSVQGSVISSLQRTSVIPVDSGEYKLIASNPAGSSELSISVTVTGKSFNNYVLQCISRVFYILQHQLESLSQVKIQQLTQI